MMFKSLLTPKYKHPDPRIRQQAIGKLSPQDSEHRSQLHDLAFNDASLVVREAALERLDQFVLWWKVAETDKHPQLKKRAMERVEQEVLAPQPRWLSANERQQFLLECRHWALLEKVVRQSADTELVLKLLAKLERPQLTRQIFFSTDNEQLQLALLDEFDDINSLLKVLKKVASARVKDLAEQQLNNLKQRQQQGQNVVRETKLVLAKLAALVDCQDYAELEQQQQLLNGEFDAQQHLFDVLPAEARDEFNAKFAALQQRLESRKQRLFPAWHAAQQQRQQQDEMVRLADNADQQLATLAEQIQQHLLSADEDMQQHWQQQVTGISAELRALPDTWQQTRQARLQQLVETLDNLAEYQQQQETARELLQQAQQLSLPEQLQDWLAVKGEFEQLQQQWKTLVKRANKTAIAGQYDAWQLLQQQWLTTVKQLEQTVSAEQNQCRRDLAKLQRLINAGKFHGALALHNELQQRMEAMPEVYRQPLQHKFEQIQTQVSELKDWQAYIAAPRKPALLAQMQTLAENPLAPEQQAEEVKALRRQWLAIGRLHSAEDDAMNEQFDRLGEQAFAPCRVFYQQQAEQRQQHVAERQKLIEQVMALSEDGRPIADKLKHFHQLQQQWRNCGEVEHRQYQQLNQHFQQHIEPLKQQVNAHYQDNQQRKQQLIEQATILLDQDDIAQSIEQAKALQQQWKQIGTAGPRQENKLWQQYRSINDQLFARRNQVQTQQREAEKQHQQQWHEQARQWLEQLEQVTDKASLNALKENLNQLLQHASGLGIAPKHGEALQQAWQQSRKAMQKQQSVSQWQQLMAVLQHWQGGDLPEQANGLPIQWQQALQQSLSGLDRKELLLQMEIVAELPSPDECQSQRQQVQLQMMANKLQHGEQPQLSALLEQWLSAGPVTDNSQLERLSAVYQPG